MTFKDCVNLCLRAPVTVWTNQSGTYYCRQLWSSFWGVLAVLLWVTFGLIVAFSTPVVALMTLAHYHKTKASRAAAAAERKRQMDADI